MARYAEDVYYETAIKLACEAAQVSVYHLYPKESSIVQLNAQTSSGLFVIAMLKGYRLDIRFDLRIT